MSVTALKPVLREIRADGNITLAEAQKLVAPKNGLGGFTDKDEFEIFTRLAKDIKKSEPAALPSKQKVADDNANNKTRLINKGLKIAGIASPIAAVATIAAVLTLAFAAPATPFIVMGAPLFIAVSLGIGALAGFLRSKSHPVSATDIKNQTPTAVAAENYKPNPGVVATGKVSAGIASVLGVGGVIGCTGFAFAFAGSGGLGSVGAAFGLGTLFSSAVIGFPALALCGIMIGVGALIGRGITKAREKRLAGTPEGAVTASPEAKALINEVIAKGVTTPDQVTKGAKMGRKIAGITSAVLVGIGALVATGAAITTGSGAGVAAAMWIFGLGLGTAGVLLVLGIGLAGGIGALVGYVQSRKNKD